MLKFLNQISNKILSKKNALVILFICLFFACFCIWKIYFLIKPSLLSKNYPGPISYNILDFGAVENNKDKNTSAINNAIEKCSLEKSCSKVIIPSGIWFTGQIKLKSNVELYLEKNSELLFSTDFSDYLPVVLSRFEGIELYNYSPMIYAKDCENVAITGQGKINGQGNAWWGWKELQKRAVTQLYNMANNDIPVEKRIFGTTQAALRPSLIEFNNCKNINLSDFFVQEGPMWTIHLLYSKDINVNKINIETTGPNTDGIVIDSSKNVLIDNITASTGDDAISIKSGLDKEGIKINRPSENIEIRNCKILKGNSGIAIGSETSGGIKNVYIHNCNIENTGLGIRIKSLLGRGGVIEDININDISMNKLTESALRFDMDYRFPTVESKLTTPPILRNVSVKNITCQEALGRGISILGLKEKEIENITLKNMRLKVSM